LDESPGGAAGWLPGQDYKGSQVTITATTEATDVYSVPDRGIFDLVDSRGADTLFDVWVSERIISKPRRSDPSPGGCGGAAERADFRAGCPAYNSVQALVDAVNRAGNRTTGPHRRTSADRMKRDLEWIRRHPGSGAGAEDFIQGEEKVEGKRTNEVRRTFWLGEAEGEPRDRGEHFDGAWTA
jgi:hypothetical protein